MVNFTGWRSQPVCVRYLLNRAGRRGRFAESPLRGVGPDGVTERLLVRAPAPVPVPVLTGAPVACGARGPVGASRRGAGRLSLCASRRGALLGPWPVRPGRAAALELLGRAERCCGRR